MLQTRMSEQGVQDGRYEALLNLARAVEAEAVAALKQHRKQHGC